MKRVNKIVALATFPLAALLSALTMAVITGFWKSQFIYILIFHILPAFSTLVASLFLVKYIVYKNTRYKNIPQSLLFSVLTVAISLFLWAGLATALFQEYKGYLGA